MINYQEVCRIKVTVHRTFLFRVISLFSLPIGLVKEAPFFLIKLGNTSMENWGEYSGG